MTDDEDDPLLDTINRGVYRRLLPRLDPTPLYAWAEANKISRETVDAHGVFLTNATFGEKHEPRPAIAFPYRVEGALIGHTYRDPAGNRAMDDEAPGTLFNVDAIETPDVVVIGRDERDVLAAYEAGYRQVVCFRATSEEEIDFALDEHHDLLGKVARFVLATSTEPGEAMELRQDLARRFGRHRCWEAKWPDGCHTLGDTLRQHGPEAVQQRIEGAEAYPLAGVHLVKPGTLLAHRQRPAPPVLTTGTHASDAKFALPGEGRLIVVTGYPNQGKSTWVTFVMMHACNIHSRRFAVFSPEMLPWEEYAARCAEIYVGKPFRGSQRLPAMTEGELANAEVFLGQHIVMLVPDSEDDAPTLDWFLGRVREAVLRYGITDALLDPWNELSFDRKGESETDHIGRSLQRLRSFGLRHGVNIWIVAHPSKPPPVRPGEKIEPPSLLSISGSSHWANKADLGFVVHDSTVICVKARFRRWGKRGDKVRLEFSEDTGRFSTPLGDQPGAGPPEPPPREEDHRA